MSTWGRKCDASPAAQFGLPFLLVFDVAVDDVGDFGVLYFLVLATRKRLSSNVRFWHKADIAAVLIHVRFWG